MFSCLFKGSSVLPLKKRQRQQQQQEEEEEQQQHNSQSEFSRRLGVFSPSRPNSYPHFPGSTQLPSPAQQLPFLSPIQLSLPAKTAQLSRFLYIRPYLCHLMGVLQSAVLAKSARLSQFIWHQSVMSSWLQVANAHYYGRTV